MENKIRIRNLIHENLCIIYPELYEITQLYGRENFESNECIIAACLSYLFYIPCVTDFNGLKENS